MRRSLPLLMAVALLGAGCSYQPVVFKGVQGVSVPNLGAQGITINADVVLENPNGYSIKVKDPDVEIHLNDLYIGKAELQQKLVLRARSTAVYHVPLQARFADGNMNVLPALLLAALSGKGELRVKGTVRAGTSFLSRRFPFEEKHTVDLRR